MPQAIKISGIFDLPRSKESGHPTQRPPSDDTARMDLGQRLEWAIDRRGTNLVELATACEVSPGAVTQWVNGTTKNIRINHLIKAADFLDVSIRWLGSGEGPVTDTDQVLREIPGDLRADIEKLIERTLATVRDLRGDETAISTRRRRRSPRR